MSWMLVYAFLGGFSSGCLVSALASRTWGPAPVSAVRDFLVAVVIVVGIALLTAYL